MNTSALSNNISPDRPVAKGRRRHVAPQMAARAVAGKWSTLEVIANIPTSSRCMPTA